MTSKRGRLERRPLSSRRGQVENAEHFNDIYIKRFKAAEVEAIKVSDKYRFPLAEGIIRQPGSDRHKTRPSRPSAAEWELVPEEDNAEEDKPTEEANPEADPSGSAEGDPVQAVGEEGFWSFPGDTVIRHHVNPRTTLFVPTDEDCPIPVKYIDVMRRTYTDLDTMAENTIDDLWTEDGAKALSNPWKGKTVFYILRPPAPPGYRWVEGRLTKVQQTTRPDSIWPEVWQSLSKKQKQVEIAKWELDRVKRDEARTKRGIIEVPADDTDYL